MRTMSDVSPRAAVVSPLLDLPPEIPFEAIAEKDVRPAIEALLDDARANVAAIAGNGEPPTYDNVLGALEAATERLGHAMGVVSHLESVRTTPALREAYVAVKPLVSAFHTSIPLDSGLWARLRALSTSPAAAALTGARKRHLENTVAEFRRHGADLPPEGKERLTAIDLELSRLTTTYAQNVLDATNAFSVLVEDEASLSGLPAAVRAVARASAELKGQAGWRFGLDAPSVIAILTHADDRRLREMIWRAHNGRASSGEHDNRPLVAEILRLRREKALLLGKKDFSDLVLEDRMAKEGDRAAAFVEDLRARTQPGFVRDTEELTRFRREIEGPDAPALVKMACHAGVVPFAVAGMEMRVVDDWDAALRHLGVRTLAR